jgi:hypothetical protein
MKDTFAIWLNYLGLEAVMADLSAWLNARIPAKTLVVQP